MNDDSIVISWVKFVNNGKMEPIHVLHKNDKLLFFILLALSTFSYWLALWYKCPYGQLDPCRKWIIDENGLIILLAFGSFSIITFNYLYYSIVFALHYPFFPYGIFWLMAVIVAWNSGNGYDFIDHGGYNRLVLAGTLSLVTVLMLSWKSLDYLVGYMQNLPYVKPHHWLKAYLIISLCSVFLVAIIFRNNQANRLFWKSPTLQVSGFLLNQSTCDFHQPTLNWWPIMSGLFLSFLVSPIE